MIRNNPPLFRDDRPDDDALTVQVSNATSHLGQLLLEADWAAATDHLASPEGRGDVVNADDPLGLFAAAKGGGKRADKLPRSKNTAFFAALFVRAPHRVIEQIFALAPEKANPSEDLAYVLSVIPSEEEARLSQQQRKVPHRTRAWTAEEYRQILDLLLQSSTSSKSSLSSLLLFAPPWAIGNSNFRLTPLAVAAYNPDVPTAILQLICTIEPRAMDKECELFGVSTIPLVVAAASPLPPKLSSGYDDVKRRRWEKVKLLILSETWYYEQRETMPTTAGSGEAEEVKQPPTAPTPPVPTLDQVQRACEESARRNEWELVRELLKHFSPTEYSAEASKVVQTETEKEVKSSALEQIRAALLKHDEEARTALQRKQQAEEKARAREEWLHRNMGLVKYPVDILVDLVSAVMPSKKHDAESEGIVAPMS